MSETAKPSTADRLWGGGYEEATHPLVQAMNASVAFDSRMAREDVIGSAAHAVMLCEQGLLTRHEHAAILAGLQQILAEIEAGTFVWSTAREDVHMNIEATLRDRIGAPAARLHTARSRNDQVALDERLWLRAKLSQLGQDLARLIDLLGQQAQAHAAWPMPGYTHLQRAQPVTVGHHLLAHAEALTRDGGRLLDLLARMDACPLGAGALAGTTLPINRERTAALLGFGAVTRNSLDSVGDRDHLVEAMAAAALGAVHLSRMGEELILFTSAEFAFVRMPDAFTTGSSLMPQKKNPDMAELIRGKSGRVIGNLVSLLVTLKGLPLAYNKDLQEDKEALFDSLDTWHDCVRVMADMVAALSWQKKSLEESLDRGFLLATDLADVLVRADVPFRVAHERVAALVADLGRRCLTFKRAGSIALSESLGADAGEVAAALDVGKALRRRDLTGAPHPARVGREARRMRKRAANLAARAKAWGKPCAAELLLTNSDGTET